MPQDDYATRHDVVSLVISLSNAIFTFFFFFFAV